jgi:hypothetical protein
VHVVAEAACSCVSLDVACWRLHGRDHAAAALSPSLSVSVCVCGGGGCVRACVCVCVCVLCAMCVEHAPTEVASCVCADV